MQVRARNVEVYVPASGAVPFDDWMRGLKDSMGKADIKAAKEYWADYKARG